MRIYFEVPCGYKRPDVHSNHSNFYPRKGEYMDIIGKNYYSFELRVQKVCFDNELNSVTITLVEED